MVLKTDPSGFQEDAHARHKFCVRLTPGSKMLNPFDPITFKHYILISRRDSSDPFPKALSIREFRIFVFD